MAYLQLLRPGQWTKNLFLFAGLVFGQRRDEPAAMLQVVLAFLCFCLTSSAVYIFNDVHDRNQDRVHPKKRLRPVACGRVSAPAATIFGVGLLVIALAGGARLDRGFFLVQLLYLVIQGTYTFGLKQLVILDVILIGTGFVLRAAAGAVVIHVPISPWLVLCTFTLCLFLGFSKRRCELNVLGLNGAAEAVRHRRTLAEYTPDLLNHMTTLTAGIAVISFLLYAVDPETSKKFFGAPGVYYLAYTLPIVVYAIFRFALLVEHGRADGPTEVLLHDRPFQGAIALWGVVVIGLVYWGQALREWLHQVVEQQG